MMANILIGCECSGALRRRFREAGHNAWSCDLKPAEDGDCNYHIMFDVFHVLTHPWFWCEGEKQWDLFICHPDCTALTVAGNHVYAAGKPKHHERLKAIQETGSLWGLSCQYAKKVCFENPQGVLSTQSIMGKASQYIQPNRFGDDASKKTGLWLKDLPKLKGTKTIPGRMVNGVERWANQTDSGQNKLGPSPQRATERARTYPGIADAMVDQWGQLL